VNRPYRATSGEYSSVETYLGNSPLVSEFPSRDLEYLSPGRPLARSGSLQPGLRKGSRECALQAFLPILGTCLRTSPLDRTECPTDGAQQYFNRSRSAPRAARRTAELSSARMFRHRGPALPAPVKGGIDA
jgi:hypothetical protein